MASNDIDYDPDTECCGSYSSEAGCCPWGDKNKPKANDNKGEKKKI